MFPNGGIPDTQGFGKYEATTVRRQSRHLLAAHADKIGILADGTPTLFLQVDPEKWAKRKDVNDAWAKLRDMYNLDQKAWDKATRDFLTFVPGRDWSCVGTMSNARQLRWHGYADTWEEQEETFKVLEQEGILPPVEKLRKDFYVDSPSLPLCDPGTKADDIIKTNPSWKGMIEPAVMGLQNKKILKSAHRHGGTTLKRFVLLGSAVSVLNSTLIDTTQVTAQQAIDWKDTVLGYNVSETQGEKAAWEFMKANVPNFDLTVINPDIITGPMIHPISGPGSINETNYFAIASFIDGTRETIEDVRFPFYHFVRLAPLFNVQVAGKVANEDRSMSPISNRLSVHRFQDLVVVADTLGRVIRRGGATG
ncbi:hypothetical protein BBP40_006087 [Aspergillus hancockii]|nr:hypothetical protein BBP40_006087 [Aspergillus hancockii]